MAVTPSTNAVGDIKTALELLTGVLVAALEADDMTTYERVYALGGQLAGLLEWAQANATQQTPPA